MLTGFFNLQAGKDRKLLYQAAAQVTRATYP